MDIVVRILRGVDLDDEMDMLEVDSSGDDISGKEDSIGLSQELFNDSLSSSSFEFAVNTEDVVLQFWEIFEVEIE